MEKRLIIGLVAALILSSCNLLEMNIFEGIDSYSPDLGSKSDIVDALQSSDPADWSDSEVTDALNTLAEDLTDLDNDGLVDVADMTDAELEAAEDSAVLTVAIAMPAFGGDEVVDNVVTALLGVLADSSATTDYANNPQDTQNLMNDLFGNPSSPSELEDILKGINITQNALTVFNDPSYKDGSNTIDLSDSDLAALMQTAITVTAVSIMYDNLDASTYVFSDPSLSEEEKKAQMLFDLMNDDTVTMAEYFGDTTELEADFDYLTATVEGAGDPSAPATEYDYLLNIIDATGGLGI